MTRSFNLVQTLKQQLKKSSITYRQLAIRLEISESAVKQMFAAGNFSLKRLDDICDVLSLDLVELIDLTTSSESRIEELGPELERELVSDLKLLLVAYCLVNHWQVEDILERYSVGEKEMIRLLAKLDRMKLIELLPDNRVRLLVSNSFKWQQNGPIEKFFRTQVQGEFFRGNFSGDGALRLIKNGDISRASQRQLIERMESIGNLFDDISREQRKQPLSRRQGTTMILAIRNWHFTVFGALERHNAIAE